MRFINITLLSIMLSLSMPSVAKDTAPSVEDKENPYVLMELFGTVFQTVKKQYVEEPKNRELIENAINGMLSALDPHSSFMNEEDFSDLTEQTKGEFGGLGIEITADKGLVRVLSPIDDTPAFKAGLLPGDYITHVNGESVIGLPLSDVVKQLRGKPGTKVKITISRTDKKPFDVDLKRAIIKVTPVKYEVKDTVGYIRIISFSETTTTLLHKAVKDITKQIGADKLTGFILDVRSNPGGLLDQAIGVVDTFIDGGEIVSTRTRYPQETRRFSSKTPDMTNGKPLVVLINEGSASASEIVAGALQDHKRGVIVGLKSFGKGSVQNIQPLEGFGGIKMTIARYYTPFGRSIQAKGIEPDITIPRGKLEAEEIITSYGEKNLHGAIENEEDKADKKLKTKKESKSKPKTDKTPESDKDKKPDYQLDRAIDILTGLHIYQESLLKPVKTDETAEKKDKK